MTQKLTLKKKKTKKSVQGVFTTEALRKQRKQWAIQRNMRKTKCALATSTIRSSWKDSTASTRQDIIYMEKTR